MTRATTSPAPLPHPLQQTVRKNFSFVTISLFLGLWLCVGFAMGTLLLLGPVRWVVDFCRSHLISQSAERGAVLTMIGVLVIISAAVALFLTHVVLESKRKISRYGVPALTAMAAIAACFLWFSPRMLQSSMGEEQQNVHFTFGPYPSAGKMRQLKSEGYTAVISLLHPAVIPFEPQLIATEKEAAGQVGLPLIQIPMLPWVSNNTAAIGQLRSLAVKQSGRYYVHCYLGMDRVLLAKKIVEEVSPTVASVAVNAGRSLKEVRSFERGDIIDLDPQTFLTPYPTNEEFAGYILPGQIRYVVALLDPNDVEDQKRIAEEQQLLSRFRIPLVLLPIPQWPYEADRVQQAVAAVRGLRGPKVVHAFFSPSTGKAPIAEAFALSFRTGLPPLAPSFFKEPMTTGPISVIAPHIATGPRPRPNEFGAYLKPRGIRDVLYIGRPDGALAVDESACGEAGLSFARLDGNREKITNLLRNGGPYYLYGPGAETLRTDIEKMFRR